MALTDGKTVVIATPRLRKVFLLLGPNNVPFNHRYEASFVNGAFKYGLSVKPAEIKIDLFISGSMAVTLNGGRLGKGTGYSDQEYIILKNAGSLTPPTPVVTTVHDIQIVENIPIDKWDISVNIIVTPTQLIRVIKAHSNA